MSIFHCVYQGNAASSPTDHYGYVPYSEYRPRLTMNDIQASHILLMRTTSTKACSFLRVLLSSAMCGQFTWTPPYIQTLWHTSLNASSLILAKRWLGDLDLKLETVISKCWCSSLPLSLSDHCFVTVMHLAGAVVSVQALTLPKHPSLSSSRGFCGLSISVLQSILQLGVPRCRTSMTKKEHIQVDLLACRVYSPCLSSHAVLVVKSK